MVRLLAVLRALTSERGGAELEELVLSAIHNCPCFLLIFGNAIRK